jgi:hypothetical protein
LMDKVYVEIVRLLLESAPVIFETPGFAMKGGTAINLFIEDNLVEKFRKRDVSLREILDFQRERQHQLRLDPNNLLPAAVQHQFVSEQNRVLGDRVIIGLFFLVRWRQNVAGNGCEPPPVACPSRR